jgi:membrane protein YdbS with pleckstrin-like domain
MANRANGMVIVKPAAVVLILATVAAFTAYFVTHHPVAYAAQYVTLIALVVWLAVDEQAEAGPVRHRCHRRRGVRPASDAPISNGH